MPDAERTLRAGVVGVGHLGALHAAKYAAAPGAALTALFDIDAAKARATAEKHPGCRAAASLPELLAAVDVVSIAVPARAHAEVGLAAADARVHVLMEKPLAADSAGARSLVRAAERAGVVLQVGHLERFNPVFTDAQRLVDHPRFIECHRLAPFAGRGVDTDVVFDVMIHDLDLIAFLVGRPASRVEAVGVAVLSPYVDIANARIRFEGGCIANVTASRVSFKKERKLRVFQEDAYLSVDFDARSALLARRTQAAGAAQAGVAPAIDVETRGFADADPLAAEIHAFLDCVRTGAAPLVGAAEGLRALELADRVVGALDTPGGDPEDLGGGSSGPR